MIVPLGPASPLLGELPDVILWTDVERMRVAFTNRGDDPVFGYAAATIRERPLRLLFPSCPEPALRKLLGRAPGFESMQTKCRLASGGDLLVHVKASSADAAGRVMLVVREVPEHAQLIAELEATNLFLGAVVENIPDMIFVKDAETLLFERFNRAGEELLGWSRDELLGKTDHDFYPKEQADFFHAMDRKTLAEGVLVDVPEEPIQTRHKGQRWLHTKKVPVRDADGRPQYLLGISEDITLRKQAEERTRALEAELGGLVRHAREAIVAWTAGGTIVAFNPAAERLYRMPADKAVGLSIEALVPPSSLEDFRATQARLLAGQPVPVRETVRLAGGAVVEVEESLFVIDGVSDAPRRIGSIAREVGELARLTRRAELLDRRGSDPPRSRPPATPTTSAMRDVMAAVDLAAKDSRASVLMLGETGVGKSWIARRLHDQSPRRQGPFFQVNCASLSRELLESELFGHEKGAFTGATGMKRGIVEVCAGGTLFLDEVGELPSNVQGQLLTFLDTRTFRRVGGTLSLGSDVRLIAATNADLGALAEKGQFRRDLYYRLSVFPVRIPPLRERTEEIPALARDLLAQLRSRSDGEPVSIQPDAEDALSRYRWPGNVRELRNVLERALVLSGGSEITIEHLPGDVREPDQARPLSVPPTMTLEEAERAHISRVLASVAGNRTRAAEVLGISRSTLKRKLAELKL